MAKYRKKAIEIEAFRRGKRGHGMSYIEKEKALENVSQIRLEMVGARAVGKTIFTEALRIYRDSVLKSLNEAPTSDVVQVVRCKDCAVPHNRWTGCPKLNGLVTSPDFYCNYGERRKEDAEVH